MVKYASEQEKVNWKYQTFKVKNNEIEKLGECNAENF
jgi:hypothetical protein